MLKILRIFTNNYVNKFNIVIKALEGRSERDLKVLGSLAPFDSNHAVRA
jgi:hypothetical protein